MLRLHWNRCILSPAYNPATPLRTEMTGMNPYYQIIRQAIIEKKIIVAMYDGLERIMCPHVIGTNRQGRPQALSYQFDGQSSSRPIQPDGSPVNWRCIDLSKLTSVEAIEGEWHTAPNHSRPQTCVANIDVEVQF